MEEMVRNVVFRGRQGAEDLYWCREKKKMYVRQPANVDSIVFWLTSSKWQGGYEADCPIKEGMVMRVVDKSGKVLYEEKLEKDEWNSGTSAKKVGDFSYEAIKKIAESFAEGRSSHREWRDLLLREKEKAGNADYDENWLYYYYDCVKETVLGTEYYLGQKVFKVKRDCKHSICGVEWSEYAVLTEDKLDCLAIAGYDLK